MIDGRYVIGICVNKIYEVHTKRFLESLRKYGERENVRLIVFHSLNDYFYDIEANEGAAAIYKLINYDYVDAVVVMPETFKNRKYVDDIIASARSADKPIISVDRELPVDVCIMPEQERVFNEMVRHLITVHGVKRPYLMAGVKDEEDSSKREAAYCRILEEFGIPVDKANYIGYGEYWSEPTKRALDKLFASGIKLPDAIVCANDTMAIAVCDYLRNKGLSVPEDMIVTGYDGIDPEDLMAPSITTCESDYDTYADHTIESALRLIEGGRTYSLWHVPLKAKFAESCGCVKKSFARYSGQASRMYEMLSSIDHVDNHWFGMTNRFMEDTTVIGMRKLLFRYMPARSAVCFNSDYVDNSNKGIKTGKRKAGFTKKMLVLAAKGDNSRELPVTEIDSDLVLPVLSGYEWRDIVVLTSIYSENRVYGYFALDMDDFAQSPRMLHRFATSLGLAVGISDRKLKNAQLENAIEELELVDATTGLHSFKGLRRKLIELYEDDPKRMRWKLVVSVYSIRNWLELIKDYGVEDADLALKMVTTGLEKANDGEYLIGRFIDGDFVLINCFEPDTDTSEEIIRRVNAFYDYMSAANADTGKAYYVEVNAGCTTADPGWEGTLEDLVKIANNELIINRLRNNAAKTKKNIEISDEKIRKFMKLVDENLFFYNFQPIVDAGSGDIYAYEALMRTPPEIGLTPVEVLDIAEYTGRLYDIEKATLFNVFEINRGKKEKFGGRRVFVNCIPGYMLSDEDFKHLQDEYEGDCDNIVIEITEQYYGSDRQMDSFVSRLDGQNWQYAIDDYGSGNSNIVNLLKFDPNLIKIDRYLITGVESNLNKQMFIKNIIEFAKNNNIKVIAEGVETLDELTTVIGFGVDLVQGYYTARPDTDVLDSIPGEIRENIISIKEGQNWTGRMRTAADVIQ